MAVHYTISEKDWPDVASLLRQFRANGKQLPKPCRKQEGRGRNGDGRWHFAKADEDIAKGDIDSTATVWRGPAWGAEDHSLEITLPIAYATHPMDSGAYMIATYKNALWYVSPLSCQYISSGVPASG